MLQAETKDIVLRPKTLRQATRQAAAKTPARGKPQKRFALGEKPDREPVAAVARLRSLPHAVTVDEELC